MGGKIKLIIFLILLMLGLHLLGRNIRTFMDMTLSTGPLPSAQRLSPQDRAFLAQMGLHEQPGPDFSKLPFFSHLKNNPDFRRPAGPRPPYGVPQNIYFDQNGHRPAWPPADFRRETSRRKPFWDGWKKAFASKEKPSSSAADNPDTSDQETFMHITVETDRAPLNNPALSARDNRMLEQYLKQLHADDIRLAKDAGELFGPRAREEVMRTLVKTERTLEKKAKTAPNLSSFFEYEAKQTAAARRQLNEIFNRYRKQYNKDKPAPYNSAQWKDFYRKYNSWKRQE